MTPHKTPAIAFVFTTLGALGLIAGIALALLGYVDLTAGIILASNGLLCVAIGQGLDYLAKSAHYAEQAALLAARSGKSAYGGM